MQKTLRRIKAVKKIQLAESKRDEDLYLTHEQLQEWFSAFKEDLENDKISLKDYVLFYLTFSLEIENQKHMLSSGNISTFQNLKFS